MVSVLLWCKLRLRGKRVLSTSHFYTQIDPFAYEVTMSVLLYCSNSKCAADDKFIMYSMGLLYVGNKR